MEYQLHSLKNGIRILHKHSNTNEISHCCVVINAGSREEDQNKIGLAHFLEHLFFKGTSHRNTNQILNRLEVVGGEINAYTTKEHTCIHASFLNQHLDRATELISDILFHSTFPDKEIKKEREVILDEIDSYLDLPEEAIQDDFEGIIFKGHALGNNILGTAESVKKINKKDIVSFLQKNYHTDEIVFAVDGGSDFQKVITIAEKYFGDIKSNFRKIKREKSKKTKAVQIIKSKTIIQSHAIIGSQCYGNNHPNKTAMLLLNNYLGGPGMSSKLNLEIREKHGICYTIESNYIPFSDTGIFSIYMGTDKDKMDKCQNLVKRELEKLTNKKLGVTSLHQAKQKFIGQISLAEENRLSVIISLAKNILEEGKADSLVEIYKKINLVTANDILSVANDILMLNKLSSLTFLPE